MKRLLIYGDSISTGTHGNNAFFYQLDALGFEITNRAVGSSGVCRNTPSSMLDQLDSFHDSDFDVILCWHGTNDWYWGSPLDDFDNSIETAVSIIRVRNPQAIILWCGPLYRFEAPYGIQMKCDALSSENRIGNTLSDYVRIIRKKCEKFGIRYLDMNASVQIHSGNAERFLEDNVHPNHRGYERIARVIVKGLSDMLYIKDGICL